MEIDLNDFFQYYNPKNKNHVNAVNLLANSIRSVKPELLQDTSEWVKLHRTPVNEEIVHNISIAWFPQTDNYTLKDSTCNSSSCAMCLEYYKPGTLPGPKGDDIYLRKVLSMGASEDHGVQTRALRSFGLESTFMYNLSFADIDKQLEEKNPVVIGILHRGSLTSPTGGHILVIKGKSKDGKHYIVNDPYGSLNDGYTGPVEKGRSALYSVEVLRYRWLDNRKDGTGWGRIFFPKK